MDYPSDTPPTTLNCLQSCHSPRINPINAIVYEYRSSCPNNLVLSWLNGGDDNIHNNTATAERSHKQQDEKKKLILTYVHNVIIHSFNCNNQQPTMFRGKSRKHWITACLSSIVSEQPIKVRNRFHVRLHWWILSLRYEESLECMCICYSFRFDSSHVQHPTKHSFNHHRRIFFLSKSLAGCCKVPLQNMYLLETNKLTTSRAFKNSRRRRWLSECCCWGALAAAAVAKF